jgi:hypothetical protein
MTSENEKKQKKQQTSSALFETFVGSFISVMMKNLKAYSTQNKKISNLLLSGYLLDECDDYFYLGESGDAVTGAIRKDEIAAIMMGDEVVELFDKIDVPEGTEVQ